jgi:hypothetical protein
VLFSLTRESDDMLARALASWARMVRWGRGGCPPEEDRRVWVRFPSGLETTLQPARGPDGPRLGARVQDVSCGGIQLVVDRPFEAGDLVSVELPAAEGGPSSTVLACVVRSAAADGGAWSVGCTFAAELADDDLRLFGARRAKAPVTDQREWVRYPCRAQATFQVVRAPAAPAAAEVLNLSAGGVGLRATADLPVGELLSVELRGGDRPALTTLACVVRVTVDPDGTRLLGCNFIGELADDDLQALR